MRTVVLQVTLKGILTMFPKEQKYNLKESMLYAFEENDLNF